MILTCPNCGSRFLLSAQALAPEGRRVRCSSCAEEWFQLPDPEELTDNEEIGVEDIPDAVKPVPEGSGVPAVAEEREAAASSKGKKVGFAAAFIVFFLVLAALIFAKDAVVKTWAPSAGLYYLLGMDVAAPGEGLVFDNARARFVAPGVIEIEGRIINRTAQEQALPVIEVSVRNGEGEAIRETIIEPPYAHLQAESVLPFKTRYAAESGEAMKGADHIQLRFMLDALAPAKDDPAKTASEDGDNTPAPHADVHAETHGGVAH